MSLTVLAGPTKCGKTTVGQSLARSLHATGRPAIVLHSIMAGGAGWPPGSFVTPDLATVIPVVQESHGCAVFLDDASATIAADRTGALPLFTCIRHRHHKLFVMCHGFTDLLPEMRTNLDTAYIFRQDPDMSAKWARLFMDEELEKACTLLRFEFLLKKPFEPVRRLKLSL